MFFGHDKLKTLSPHSPGAYLFFCIESVSNRKLIVDGLKLDYLMLNLFNDKAN